MEDGLTRNTEFRMYYCDAAVLNKGRSVIGCSSTTTERVSISEMALLVCNLVAIENFHSTVVCILLLHVCCT